MLVSLGLITRGQLEQALDAQGTSKLPIGKQLVALGAVSETRLTQVLSNQLSVPWVSLERIDFPAELLNRIPGEVADALTVMPVYVRNVRGKGATLYVAMDDPTDDDALRLLGRAANLPVRPMIAPPSEIRRVIEQRYFGVSAAAAGYPEDSTGLRSLPGRGAKQFSPAGESSKAAKAAPPQKLPQRKPPPPPAAPVRQEGTVLLDHYDTPSQPPPEAKPAGRTLTLLDGTRIQLPVPGSARKEPEIRSVRHVVKAIRSARGDSASDEPLRWHDVLQTVLHALEARGVQLTRAEVAAAWAEQKARQDQQKAQST